MPPLGKDWLPTDLDQGERMDALFKLLVDLSPHVGWEVTEADDDEWTIKGLAASPAQLGTAMVIVVKQLRRAQKDDKAAQVAQWAWAAEQLAGLLSHISCAEATERRGLN